VQTVLDRTATTEPAVAETRPSGEAAPRIARRPLRRLTAVTRRVWYFVSTQSFSSLTRRIVFLNVAGLLALVLSILYLSQFRAGLIDARVQSLLVQGEIIAGAVAASATVETDTITIDPDKLLELQTGESYGPPDESLSGLDFPINPERVAPLLRRLVLPTGTQARIYDREGVLLLDSRNLYGRGDVLRFDLNPPDDRPTRMERAWIAIKNWFGRGDLPLYRDLGPANGKGYPEVAKAIGGVKASEVRVNDRGDQTPGPLETDRPQNPPWQRRPRPAHKLMRILILPP